jgi:basic membrane protein A and related proteins
VKAVQDGKPFTNFLRGGLKEGFVKASPYGKAVSDGARKDADGIKAKMLKDEFVIFKGPLKDNTGKVVIPGGTMQKQTDIVLEQMNYLVAGVVGKV